MSSNESKWTQVSLNEPKAKMGWNEPKRTQKKTLDQKTNSEDPKYIQNNPIWAKNEPY